MNKKISIDFGGSRIKATFQDKTGKLINIQFSNRYDEELDSAATGGIFVEREDGVVRLGGTEGTPNREILKINYEHVDNIILACVGRMREELKSTDKHFTLDIETLLPPEQFFADGDEFQELIKKIGKITGKVDGVELTVEIGKVGLNCEGVALLNSVDISGMCGEIEKCLLIDAGSSTMDFVSLVKVNGQWDIVGAETNAKVGGGAIIKAIQKKLRKITEFKGVELDFNLLEKEMGFWVGETKHLVKDYIEYADETIAPVQKDLRRLYKGGKVLVSGGAAELLMESDKFKEIIPQGVKPVIVPEDIRTFGNSVGAFNS